MQTNLKGQLNMEPNRWVHPAQLVWADCFAQLVQHLLWIPGVLMQSALMQYCTLAKQRNHCCGCQVIMVKSTLMLY